MSEESVTQNSEQSDSLVNAPQEAPQETEAKPEETKPEDEAKPEGEPDAEGKAEAVTLEDIKLPDDLIVPDDLKDKFLGVLNNKEMSLKDRAQALIDLQAEAAQKASEMASQEFEQQQKLWQDEVKNDPEIGGEKFESTINGISRLVDEYGSEELVQVMATTGAGNNIHVIKFLNQIAQKLNEPSAVSGQPANVEENPAVKLFPSMKG